MKKNTKRIILVIVIILVLAGAYLAINSGSSKVEIVGSTSVQPVAEKLVEKYKETHPDAQINVQGGGSSVGIKSAQDGTADIGTSSKALKKNESQGLTQIPLGQDGIVIAVNTKNSVDGVTSEQLKDIFSGKITNWKEVGGSDGKINVIRREDGSGTLDAFESIVMGKDTKIKSDAVVQSSTEAVKQSVKTDENAIGFVSYAHMSSDVKALKIDGVSPSDDTIADGSYKLQRPFLFLVKGTSNQATQDFLNFVNSREGQKVLKDEKIVQASNNTNSSQ
ncbi:MAG: phosphate ABC transporter substrate-binding protein [Methanobrevibacter boviskoreani]|jgi:phosphate transport system substrate-binding protein|uniref:phosphate ABC transporter substrate-binding protein n=1 Tax=Methanobrevibacter boviskoreani TaxID=1348249 RepID=UPI0005935A58|nr:phosphate ABC transporter substrate-binding protein [Methanobrevibacter boviskoreani]MCI6931374.1 phosphate ABC transporter substrate-binding protein [Methanobrevibacter boviskoreani]MDD6256108.1 phosphate ABC transporter substrate-binding protein [Methanobrevibacter boviskoreani]